MTTLPGNNEIKKDRLREFYKTQFDPQILFSVLGERELRYREFGFESLEGTFYRNISFPSKDDLMDHLISSVPGSIYIGSIYSEPPSRDKPIHSLEWRGHELVFDIDLSDYERTCDCKAKEICSKCWSLMRTAVYFLDETLRDDFGFSKIQWCFSGRRGIHAWVADKESFKLTQRQRTAIVEYLTFVKGEDKDARIESRTKPVLNNRIHRWIDKAFLEEATKEDLTTAGFSKNKVSEIIRERKKKGITNGLLRRIYSTADNRQYDYMIRMRYPRLDTKVSIDLRRLLRAPGSIHGGSGKLCRVLSSSEIESFDPIGEPSIFEDRGEN